MSSAQEYLTVVVPKGTKVNVEESDDISGGDKRIPSDRNLLVKAPGDLKIAVARSAFSPDAKSSIITMCG